MRRIGLILLAAILTCALAVAKAATVSAAGPEFAPVMLVLDASGSMTARDAGHGVSRMDAAKRAMASVIGSLPDVAQVGLAVYGTGTGSSEGEKAAGCQDVRVVARVGPVNRAALSRSVTGLRPRGYTPIGRALRTAADQLPKNGRRSIVLVSDGEDTCAPPQPCDVARELARAGVDLRVHTVGFKVDPAARAQLACIAQATGGTYADAEDAGVLGSVLGRVTDRALREYEPSGTPVIGTAQPGDAPTLHPGQYLDTVDPTEDRHYAVDLAAGVTAYFAATTVFPRGTPRDIETVDVKLLGPGGADCYVFIRELNTFARDGGTVTATLRWDGLVPGSPRGHGECGKPGRYTFRVSREHAPTSTGTDRVPLELLLRVEPPVTGDQGPAADRTPVAYTQPTGTPRPARGGGTFSDAATLDGGGQYTDTLYYGEQVFYRVRLGWGQGLAYRVRFDRPEDHSLGALDVTANVETTLYSPVRLRAGWETTSHSTGVTWLPYEDSKAIATPRVLYQNRTAAFTSAGAVSIDGWYYISVRLGLPVGGRSDPPLSGTPITLDLSVAGQPIPAPRYGAAPGAEASAVPSTPAASPPTPTGDAASQPRASLNGTGGSDRRWWWVAGVAGLGVLVAGGFAVPLLVRRRSRRQPPWPVS